MYASRDPPLGVTLTGDVAWVCQLRGSLRKLLLVGVADANITGSNWSVMIKCQLRASYNLLADEAQYPEVLNRTHQLHV